MSYTSEVKGKLCSLKMKKCCSFACLYGLLLFGARLGDGVKYVTSHKDKSDFACKLFAAVSKGTMVESLHGDAYETEILPHTDDSGLWEMLTDTPLRIHTEILNSECCKKAFLRGAFIGSGFVSDPEKPYHLELNTSHHLAAEDFRKISSEYELNFKTMLRNGRTVLYIKSSEQFKDFLTIIGAQMFTFDYANAELEKDLRNGINRTLNCESANEDKRLDAAAKQIKDITVLKEDGYRDVPQKLIELAEVRLANPEAGLAELGMLLEPPLSKAGVSHRMKKIAELSIERKK